MIDTQKKPPTPRRRWLSWGLRVLGGLAFLGALWVFWWEPTSLRVEPYTIDAQQWPESHGPLRIAVLGDTHSGAPLNGQARLAMIVDATLATNPDLILLAGDYVYHGLGNDDALTPEIIAAELARLEAPLGVFAVLGNHDWWDDAERARTSLQDAGLPVIDDRAVRVGRNGGAFWVVGVSDLWHGPSDLRGTLASVSDDDPVILLTHNPDLFTQISDRVALTIAGHTHGGQVRIPFYGPVFVPSNHGTRFAQGHVEEDGRHLFVTPGLGTTALPVRLGVPPEISLVTLK